MVLSWRKMSSTFSESVELSRFVFDGRLVAFPLQTVFSPPGTLVSAKAGGMPFCVESPSRTASPSPGSDSNVSTSPEWLGPAIKKDEGSSSISSSLSESSLLEEEEPASLSSS